MTLGWPPTETKWFPKEETKHLTVEGNEGTQSCLASCLTELHHGNQTAWLSPQCPDMPGLSLLLEKPPLSLTAPRKQVFYVQSKTIALPLVNLVEMLCVFLWFNWTPPCLPPWTVSLWVSLCLCCCLSLSHTHMHTLTHTQTYMHTHMGTHTQWRSK